MRLLVSMLLCILIFPTSLQSTLIVEMPAKEGILVCADTRQTIGSGPAFLDGQPKIFRLGPKCGFYISGAPLIVVVANRKPAEPLEEIGRIDFVNLTKTWFSSHSCSDKDWNQAAFGGHLLDSLKDFLNSVPVALRPAIPDDTQHTLVTISVFYQKENQDLALIAIPISYTQVNPPAITGRVDVQTGNVQLAGVTQIFSAAMAGDIPEVTNQPQILPIFNALRSGTYQGLPYKEEEVFARSLIRLTAKTNIPGVPQGTVSEESKCALLDKEQGFIDLGLRREH